MSADLDEMRDLLEPILSRLGMRRYLNGDSLTLDPSDIRDIIKAARAIVSSAPGPGLTERVTELEALLQKAARGLRFRSQYTNGDPVRQELWAYMMKHYPQHEGRMSGWASMREDWKTNSGPHCFGCQCEKCRAAINARQGKGG